MRALVAQPQETKYRADYVEVYGGGLPSTQAHGFGVLQNIISGGINFQAWNLIPSLAQGVGGASRVGNKITDVTLKSTWQFWINPQLANNQTLDATVKVFILKSKSAKAFPGLQSLPAGSLLDAGDATTFDWLPASPLDAKAIDMLPVNKEQFTVLKIHKFRICKNQDSPTGGIGASASPNMERHQTKDFTHTLKHKSAVVYADTNIGGVLPTNLNYFAYVVMYDTNTFANLPVNSVLCNARAQMYFKDA